MVAEPVRRTTRWRWGRDDCAARSSPVRRPVRRLCRASSKATAEPMPPPPPVTMAIWSAHAPAMTMTSLGSGRWREWVRPGSDGFGPLEGGDVRTGKKAQRGKGHLPDRDGGGDRVAWGGRRQVPPGRGRTPSSRGGPARPDAARTPVRPVPGAGLWGSGQRGADRELHIRRAQGVGVHRGERGARSDRRVQPSIRLGRRSGAGARLRKRRAARIRTPGPTPRWGCRRCSPPRSRGAALRSGTKSGPGPGQSPPTGCPALSRPAGPAAAGWWDAGRPAGGSGGTRTAARRRPGGSTTSVQLRGRRRASAWSARSRPGRPDRRFRSAFPIPPGGPRRAEALASPGTSASLRWRTAACSPAPLPEAPSRTC